MEIINGKAHLYQDSTDFYELAKICWSKSNYTEALSLLADAAMYDIRDNKHQAYIQYLSARIYKILGDNSNVSINMQMVNHLWPKLYNYQQSPLVVSRELPEEEETDPLYQFPLLYQLRPERKEYKPVPYIARSGSSFRPSNFALNI